MPHPPNRLNTIRLAHGQTKRFRITVKDQDGRPAKLNRADDIIMTVRNSAKNIVFTKRLDDGIKITDADRGVAEVTLSSVDTELAATSYTYDIWVTYPGSPPVRDPVIKTSALIVTESVTDFV